MRTIVMSCPTLELEAEVRLLCTGVINFSLDVRILTTEDQSPRRQLFANMTPRELARFAAWMREAAERYAPDELSKATEATPSALQQAGATFDWFEVDEFNTLTPLGHQNPETRRGLLDLSLPATIDAALLADWLDQSPASSNWASTRAAKEAENYLEEFREVVRKLKADERARVRAAHEQVETHGDAWAAWVRLLDAAELSDWIADLNTWLDDAPDSQDWDYLPEHTTGQRIAFRYFRDMDSEALDALDVITVEGDRPGSSYIAAELNSTPEEANRIAKERGLTCRFCRPGDRITSEGEIEE
jgi:hypothetical protein